MEPNSALSRRTFLRGLGVAGAAVRVGLPALDAMFNSSGNAYAATLRIGSDEIESRFVLWFNGNGIIERFWIPRETGSGYRITPCLTPLAPHREDVHIITRSGQPRRAATRARQRSSPLDERANVGYLVHRSWLGRAVDRSSDRQ